MGVYGIRLCAGSLLAAICLGLSGGKEQIRWVCSLFLIILVIAPLREMDLDFVWELTDEIYDEAQSITDQAARDTLAEIQKGIIEQTRTYILDEAASLGAEIQVVALSLEEDGFVPVGVELAGTVSPYQRKMLSGILQEDLGIGKEGQIWKDGSQ